MKHILANANITAIQEMFKSAIAIGMPAKNALELVVVWAIRMTSLNMKLESLDPHNFHGTGETYAHSYSYVRRPGPSPDPSNPSQMKKVESRMQGGGGWNRMGR